MSLARNATPAGTTRPTSNDVEDGEIIEPTTAANNNNNTPIAVSSTSSPRSQTVFQSDTPLGSPRSSTTLFSAAPSPIPAHGVSHHLTPDELDSAKSLVLDLLGWGVEPEYLVDCGVSPAVIHRIFTDLRLRLPRNLAFPA
ncbi:hypothetical protein C8J57DRAFT_1289338 [Mycena rebaudengoi]|nr:hypothetical protein C8J57DRAFT_1289338 [Mycena rebaudengoi]